MLNLNTPDDEWEWYLGQLYFKLIKDIVVEKINVIVELAPGFRYKIAYALKEINFDGILYIIDTSDDVIEFVNKKYKELLPDATIICIKDNFKNAHKYIKEKVDLFLSNHSVDDLIIFRYMNSYNYKLNNDIQNNIDFFWKKLLNDEKCNLILKEIKSDYINFFKRTNTKYIIMAQYKSNVFINDDNNYISNIVSTCFMEIKKYINIDNAKIDSSLSFYPFGEIDKRYNYKELLDNMQTSSSWIAGTFKEDYYGNTI